MSFESKTRLRLVSFRVPRKRLKSIVKANSKQL